MNNRKGAFVYQQIEQTTAEWAANDTIYPPSHWLFERLENGKFNMKLSDGVHTFSELPAVLQDVVVEIESDTASEYILKFITAKGTIYTPNLRTCIGVEVDNETQLVFSIRNGDKVLLTPNLRIDITEHENTAESYKLSIRSGDKVSTTPNLRGSSHPRTPTLSEKPVESTLTYTEDGKETAFVIGQLARVPSKKQRSGYTFYQLAALSEDGTAASWQEAGSGGSGGGKVIVEQTGIFANAGAGWNSFTFPFPFSDDIRVFLTPGNVRLKNQTRTGFHYCLYTPLGEMDADTTTLINWQAAVMSEEQLCANIAKATGILDPLEYFTLAELFTSDNASVIVGNEASLRLMQESARATAAYLCTVVGLNVEDYPEMTSLCNDEEAMRLICENQTAMQAVAASAVSLIAIALSETAIGAVFGDATAFGFIDNEDSMAALAASPVALRAIALSATRETFEASELFSAEVLEKDSSIAMYAAACAELDPAEWTTMQSIAASAVSLSAVASSETARNAVQESEHWNEIAENDRAITRYALALAGRDAEECESMAALAASATAMAALAASATAMAALAASATALLACARSAVAAEKIKSAVQDQRAKILLTLGTANSAYFTYTTKTLGNGKGTFDDGANTNTIYIPYTSSDDGDTPFTVYYGVGGDTSIVSIEKHSGNVAVNQGVSFRGVRVIGTGSSVGNVGFHIYTAK